MRILITGENSYIGNSFKKYMLAKSTEYHIDTISVRNDDWKQMDFSIYDAIFHVAAIVHINPKKIETKIYNKVNRDLPVEIAKKAKQENVKQFVFMSTMAVYGLEGEINKKVVINQQTPYMPKNGYGRSKYEAEKLLLELQDEGFIISIVRPPMVYGPDCVGNYTKVSNIVKKVGVFPEIKNERSMIYIKNLCECIKVIMDRKVKGIVHPQDKEYINTTELAKAIAKANSIKLRTSKTLGFGIKNYGGYLKICSKAFGNLIYDPTFGGLNVNEYAKMSFREAINETESVEVNGEIGK